MSKLKVDYSFYHNFSRYLKKGLVKNMGGVREITQTVLHKIATYPNLSERDLDVCMQYNNERVTKALLRNCSVPFHLKAKMIRSYKLQSLSVLNQVRWKENLAVRKWLVEYLNELLEKGKDYSLGEFETMWPIIAGQEDLTLPLAKLTVVSVFIARVGRRRYIDDKMCVFRKLEIADIENCLKYLLLEDVKKNEFNQTQDIVSAIEWTFRHSTLMRPEVRGALERTLSYAIREVVPSINYSDKGGTSISSVVLSLIDLVDSVSQEGRLEEVMLFLKNINIEQVHFSQSKVCKFLIECIQKHGGHKDENK